jgi:hypothetical protein
MKVMDPEQDKRTSFLDCLVINLTQAAKTRNLALKSKAGASSTAEGRKADLAVDDDAETSWKAASSGDQWLELQFTSPITVNEFKLMEDKSSTIDRYAIQYYDDKAKKWTTCFNGMHIKREFVAPIVSRRTRGVRLVVKSSKSGLPAIAEFAAYNNTGGKPFSDPKGIAARNTYGQ